MLPGMTALARPQAKDIADMATLRVSDGLGRQRHCWTSPWDVAENFPAFPEKVVAAKLKSLHRRGLVTGCPCGCRGDWELTDAGYDVIDIDTLATDSEVRRMRAESGRASCR